MSAVLKATEWLTEPLDVEIAEPEIMDDLEPGWAGWDGGWGQEEASR